jgi:hypothetical protein
MKRPKTAAKEKVGDVLMTTTVSERKKPDEVRQAGRQESDAPELLVGYLEKIGRDRLLTSREKISLSSEHVPETEEPARSW